MEASTTAPLRSGPMDVHAHVVPEALFARCAAGERPGFDADQDERGRRRLTFPGRAPAPVLPALSSLDHRLRTMDEQGVAVQLLSPATSLVGYSLPAEDGVWLNRALNQSIAALVRQVPDRFRGLGSVPLQAPERAAELLHEVMHELELEGVLIGATAGRDRDLDDPTLEPFWAAAEALQAFVFIHPHQGIQSRRFDAYGLTNLIQNPLDTTTAAAHLIFGGVLERHPDLRICLAHGGGFLPYNLGRLARGRAAREDTRGALAGSVEESFRRFYFDTVTHSPSILGFLIQEATPAHVLLGSDYPYDMGDPTPVATVQRALPAAEAAFPVLRGNADRLFAGRRPHP